MFLLLGFCIFKIHPVEKVNAKSGLQVKLYVPLDYRTFKPLYINDFRMYFSYFFQTNKRSFLLMNNNIISCEFNIDTACVEVKLTDGSMVSIDCLAVENEYANNMYETSELDFLIYNEPMSYVRLLLSGKMEEYLRNNTDYTPLSELW